MVFTWRSKNGRYLYATKPVVGFKLSKYRTRSGKKKYFKDLRASSNQFTESTVKRVLNEYQPVGSRVPLVQSSTQVMNSPSTRVPFYSRSSPSYSPVSFSSSVPSVTRYPSTSRVPVSTPITSPRVTSPSVGSRVPFDPVSKVQSVS